VISAAARAPRAARAKPAASLENALAVVTAVYAAATLCDYGLNWAWPELPFWNLPFAMSNGPGFSLWDLGQSFNSFCYDHVPRGRFLSYFFEHMNLKLRVRLWDFIPPHPTLSLVWIPAFLSLIPLNRLLETLGLDKLTARVVTTLYVFSPGFLSSLTLHSHPAKALGNAAIILALWQASRLERAVRAAGRYGEREALGYAGLLGALFLGMFADETAWFAAAAVPLLFPRLFLSGDWRQRRLLWPAYLLPAVAYFGLLKTFDDSGSWRGLTGWPGFYWRHWMTMDQDRNPLNLGTVRYALNTYYMLASHLTVFARETIDRSPNWPFWASCAAVGGVGALLRRELPAERRGLLAKLLLALFAYSVFHDRLMSRWPVIISGLKSCYYYGAPFSLFLVLPLGVLLGAGLASVRRGARLASQAGLTALLVVFALNLRSITLHSMLANAYEYDVTRGMDPDPLAQNRLTFAKAARAWRLRGDRRALAEERPRYAMRDLWLFTELEASRPFLGWRTAEASHK
jgi:hypothetical protein